MRYLICFLAVFTAVGTAQLITTATINGTVTDSSGGVVPDAAVALMNEETHTVIATNADGRYAAPGLSVGTYTVTVKKPGFQTYNVTGIVPHPTIVNTADAALAAGQVDTQITAARDPRIAETVSEVYLLI